MKKIFLIIILCLSNVFIFYSRDKEVSIEKIDINLQFNELGIILLDLNDSNTLIWLYKSLFFPKKVAFLCIFPN